MSDGSGRVAVTVSRALAPGVLPAVVAMLAARTECPLDRLDEALLLADAIAAHAPGRSRDGAVHLDVDVDDDGLRLVVGALAPGGADGLIADASLPGVGGLLERIADELQTEEHDDGERLVLRVRYETPTATSSSIDRGVPR